jgi:hypothetical protein
MKLSKAKAASGKVIKFTGQNWDVGEDENTTYTQGVGIQISGARITNTAPNATHIGDVTGSETLTIADNVIDSSNINAGSISNNNLKPGSINGDRLNRMGALNSQVLTFSNGTWAPVDNNSHLHLSSQISDATADNATDKIVMRDAWGNFSAGTITATLNGGASYAMQSEKWSTPRTVTLQGGVTGAASLDGSKNVIVSTTVVDNNHQHLSSNISDATDLASAGKVVKRDMNGNFSAKLIYADLDGTASRSNTADNAAKADIAKVSDKLTNSLTLNLGSELGGNVSFFGNEGAVSLNAIVTNAVSANTPDAIVRRNTDGNFDAGTITASLNGNASTASKWQTRRTFSLIGGVTGSNNEIDGSGDAVISCTVANNSHSHISSNISDATSENIADKIVKRSSNGFFDAGGANIGNLNTAYYNNLNVYGITNFYSKLNSSSSASFIKVSQCSDNSSDISPGTSTTGHLGYYNKWKDINVNTLSSDELTSTNGTISNLNSTYGFFYSVTSSYGAITNLSSSSATIAGSLIGSTYNGSLTVNGRLYLTVGRDRSDNPVTLSFYHGSENNGQEMKIIPSTGCFDLGSASHTFATIYCYSLIENSDRRIKENITPLFGALEKILKLRAVKFDLKSGFYPTNDPDAGKNRIGFIAQEVLEIIPQAVHFDSSSNLYGIKYDNIIPFLTKAIQEQQNTIDSLRLENKKNENRIANLEKRLIEIERKLK